MRVRPGPIEIAVVVVVTAGIAAAVAAVLVDGAGRAERRLAVAASVPVSGPVSALAESADGITLFVGGPDGIAVLDAATGAPRSRIPASGRVDALTLSPDGSRLYATVSPPGATGGELLVIDTATSTEAARAPVPQGVLGLAASPDGSRIHLTASGEGTLSVLDAATGNLEGTVRVGETPLAVAVAGARVYVEVEGGLGVVEATGVVATVPTGAGLRAIAVAPDGARVYALSNDPAALSVIDAGSGSVVGTVPVGEDPVDVAVAPDGSRIYVVSRGGGTVTEIAGDDLTVLATLPVGPSPDDAVLSRDGSTLRLVVDGGAVVSLATGTEHSPAGPVPAASVDWAATAGVIGPVRTRYAEQVAAADRGLAACPAGGIPADPGCAAAFDTVLGALGAVLDEVADQATTDELAISLGPLRAADESFEALGCAGGFAAGGPGERDAGCTEADATLRTRWRDFTVSTARY